MYVLMEKKYFIWIFLLSDAVLHEKMYFLICSASKDQPEHLQSDLSLCRE